MHFDFILFFAFAGLAFGGANLADDLRLRNVAAATFQAILVLICAAYLAIRFAPA